MTTSLLSTSFKFSSHDIRFMRVQWLWRFDEIPRYLSLSSVVLRSPPWPQLKIVASFEKRITVKKLDNGLTIIICERPEAPVFSFDTHVDAGSVQDPMGQTGMAHMFEHMAFKGTDTIGTTDYAAENVALAQVEKAYAAFIQERDKPFGRNDDKLKELQKAWQDAIAAAQKYVNPMNFRRFLKATELKG